MMSMLAAGRVRRAEFRSILWQHYEDDMYLRHRTPQNRIAGGDGCSCAFSLPP